MRNAKNVFDEAVSLASRYERLKRIFGEFCDGLSEMSEWSKPVPTLNVSNKTNDAVDVEFSGRYFRFVFDLVSKDSGVAKGRVALWRRDAVEHDKYLPSSSLFTFDDQKDTDIPDPEDGGVMSLNDDETMVVIVLNWLLDEF